jgi:hypothetical protein
MLDGCDVTGRRIAEHRAQIGRADLGDKRSDLTAIRASALEDDSGVGIGRMEMDSYGLAAMHTNAR